MTILASSIQSLQKGRHFQLLRGSRSTESLPPLKNKQGLVLAGKARQRNLYDLLPPVLAMLSLHVLVHGHVSEGGVSVVVLRAYYSYRVAGVGRYQGAGEGAVGGGKPDDGVDY